MRKLSGSVNSGESEGRRTGFMAMLRKKKPKAPKSVDGSNTIPTGSSAESGSNKEAITPANGNRPLGYRVVQQTMAGRKESRERAERIKSRIGSYPLDPYDPVLLDKYVSWAFATATSFTYPFRLLSRPVIDIPESF